MNRIVSVLLAVLLVAPPLLEARHASRTTHVRCPLDGQIEDAREDELGVPHSHAAGVLLPAPPDTSGHVHEACAVVQAARPRAFSALSTSPVSRLFVAPLPTPHGARDVSHPCSFPIYLLAPKLSPPLS